MAKLITYKTKCKQCESPVYYTPVKLMMEYLRGVPEPDEEDVKLVDAECTGEVTGFKHTNTYIFPLEFKKV